MQKIIITTDCEEDVILRVLQGLKQGTVELPDGAGGMEPMGCCTFTCKLAAQTQGYLLEEPEDAYHNGELVGYENYTNAVRGQVMERQRSAKR